MAKNGQSGSLPAFEYVGNEQEMIKKLGSEAAVRREFKKVRDIAVKRVKRLKDQGMLNESVLKRYETGVPTATGKSTAALARELAIMVRLLDYRATSSVSGIKAARARKKEEVERAAKSLKEWADKVNRELKKIEEEQKKAEGSPDERFPWVSKSNTDDSITSEYPDFYYDEDEDDFDIGSSGWPSPEPAEGSPGDDWSDYDIDEIVAFTQDVINLADSLHMESEIYKRYGGGKSGFDAMAQEMLTSGLYKTGDASVGLAGLLNEVTSGFKASQALTR